MGMIFPQNTHTTGIFPWVIPTLLQGWKVVALGPTQKFIWHATTGFQVGSLPSTLTFCCFQLRIILLVSGHKRQVYRFLSFVVFKVVGMWTTHMTSTKHDMAQGAIREHITKWFCWRGVCILPIDGNNHFLLLSFCKTDLSQMTLCSFCCSLPKIWITYIIWAPHACMTIIQCTAS